MAATVQMSVPLAVQAARVWELEALVALERALAVAVKQGVPLSVRLVRLLEQEVVASLGVQAGVGVVSSRLFEADVVRATEQDASTTREKAVEANTSSGQPATARV